MSIPASKSNKKRYAENNAEYWKETIKAYAINKGIDIKEAKDLLER